MSGSVVRAALGVLWAAAACGLGSGAGGARQDTAGAAAPAPPASDSAATATDDCVRGEPQPTLNSRTGRFRQTGKLAAVEEARLDDTTSLRILHGGCAHYVETFEFTVRGAVRDTADSRYWVRQAVAYLRRLDLVEDRRSLIGELAAPLERAAGAQTPYTYGDPLPASEMALVSVNARPAGPRTVVLEIVYDVAL